MKQNLPQVPQPTISRTTTQFFGPVLWWLRAIWIALAALIVTLVIIGLPHHLEVVMQNPRYDPVVMTQVGLSPHWVAWYDVALDILTIGASLFVASILFLRRSNERMALLTSLMLLTWGSTAISGIIRDLAEVSAAAALPIRLIQAVGQALLIYFGYTFPDGRYNPAWTRWLVRIYGVWIIASALFPNTLFAQKNLPGIVSFIIDLVVYVGAVAVQVYRFRKVLTPEQVQQGKWVIYGMVAAIIGFLLVYVPPMIFPSLNSPSTSSLFFELFLQTALLFTLPALPVSIGLCILRYRLWDVDFIINRSLVYGALTLLLIAVFGISLTVSEQVLDAVTGGQSSPLALSASAVVIGFMFNPARVRLRRFVDRRLYGIKIDYTQPGGGVHPASGSHTGESFRSKIGSYEIIESLGWGGMSEVYLARQPSLNRMVAIKMLAPGIVFNEDSRQRFEREARAMAALKHPNILEIYDFGEHQDIAYMVIEYVSGPDLAQVIKERGTLSVGEVCGLMQALASALDTAHTQGIVHRDVKPSNVLMKPVTGSEGWMPILSDFGLARMMNKSTGLTATALGTIDYIAPEQIRNAPDLDGRADIYSLGVMAFEMLTGQLPFTAGHAGAVLMAHLSQPAPDACSVKADLSDAACAAIMRAMQKERSHRYNTAGEFATALCA